jgi:outer membrane protein OmpA-like peptidoglycan-associated protein
MANSMFESILGMVTPEMTQSIASRLGESPSAVQQGMGAATAATLYGLAKNSSEPGFIEKVMQMVSHPGSQNVTGNLASIVSGGANGGSDLISRFGSLVFGSQQEHISNLVSQHSGLSGTAGSGLLKTVGALVLGYFAKMRSSGSLTASTLASALRTEGANLSSHVPGGFLGSLGGTVSDTAARATGHTSNVIHTYATRPQRTGTWWAIPVAALAVLALFAAWLSSHHRNTTSRTAMIEAPQNAPRMTISLPDGSQLRVISNGVETKLVSYLQSPSAQNSQVDWFDFDRLLFNTGQATLQPQSNQQLDNVAAILKAYPAAKIRLGGYTDNTGDPTANQKLSEERADSVMTALEERGIDSSRLSAQGYGEENPVADNSTPEGRQKNRRISIRVAEK